jgi:hypothetical protein
MVVTLVPNANAAVDQRKGEGFVLSPFENTIRWVERRESVLGHTFQALVGSAALLRVTKNWSAKLSKKEPPTNKTQAVQKTH